MNSNTINVLIFSYISRYMDRRKNLCAKYAKKKYEF